MDPTALLPSKTATPATPAAARVKPAEAGAEDFAALVQRAGQDPASAATPGMPATQPSDLPAPAALPCTPSTTGLSVDAIPVAKSQLAPPAPTPAMPVAKESLLASTPGLQKPIPSGTDSDEVEEPEVSPDPATPATTDPLLTMPAGTMLLPLPPPAPPPVPVMTGASASAPAPRVTATATDIPIAAGSTEVMEESPATDTTPKVPLAAVPGQEQADPGKPIEVPGARLPDAPRPGPRLALTASTQPGPEAAAAPSAAGSMRTSPAPQGPAPVLPAPPQATSLPTPQPVQANPLKPQPSRDRPMAVAAVIGQATAKEQDATAAVAPDQPMATPERGALAPTLVAPTPHRPAEPAKAQPAQPDPLQAMPSGLSPPPTATMAPDSAAPVATASAAPTAPPSPPARQVAQVTIALAMGQGQAPRLTVALEPESLGRVEIRIERGAEGEPASVQVLAERPETLALLQRDARELDRTLAQAGVVVASGGTQFGLSGGNGGQPQEQRPPQQGGGGGQSGRTSLVVPGPVQATLNALSLLDIAV